MRTITRQDKSGLMRTKLRQEGTEVKTKDTARQTAMHACEMSGNDELLLLEG